MIGLRHTIVLLLALVLPSMATAEPVVADLSDYVISIDSGFTGTDVLLFGAVEDEGDLVVVVRGPTETVAVRRKDRVAGIWVNRETVEFENVPSYYTVATSRPLDDIAPINFRILHQIGLDALRLVAIGDRPAEEIAPFREALIRNRVREGLYGEGFDAMKILSDRLFSTPLHFPANVSEGTYHAEVFLIRDGAIVSAEQTPLFINKSGFQWEIHHYAHAQPELYGMAAILIALFAGWLAAAVFRKG
ncbi:MAG: TIGR02186 family protein [Alphaproteobacteria bacterium]|jgi:uncharacterized protein (TIGR02186 family)